MSETRPDWDRLIGVPITSDFPAGVLFDVYDLRIARLRPDVFEHDSGAWNSIAYRSIMVARSDEAFRASGERWTLGSNSVRYGSG
jgi:hypothetical protein